MDKNQEYFIGIDLGTGSVGYAVTDTYGKLLKFKSKNMMGVNLFDEAQSAKDTRLFRCSRRCYDRRKTRISYLQGFLSDDIKEIDEYFYLRLKQSSLWSDDKDETVADIYTLFNDRNFDEKQYYKDFPTIYHLRKFLIESNKKEDIRLVYLALHSIVKYRGNFLYEDVKNLSAKNSQLKPAAEALPELLSDIFDTDFPQEISNEIAEVLSDAHKTKRNKAEEVEAIINNCLFDKSVSKNIAYAMVGYKADFIKMFRLEADEKLSVSLSDEDADEKVLPCLDDTQAQLYETLKKIYSSFVLSQILVGENVNCLSDAMIEKYENHKKDLKDLKKLIRDYFPKYYSELFRGKKANGAYVKSNEISYTNYIISSKTCPRDKLCGKIKKILETKAEELKDNEKYKRCIERIDAETFLSKINSTDNGAIPFQLHLEEMAAIIDNQGKYYKSLIENKDKLCSLVSFRIPYYVGPLNEKRNPDENQRQFAWMIRKTDGEKIYPWNFESIVDIDKSAENFIRRMTNKCAYLPNEDVIPKYSLLYCEYMVRNELKQIKIDGKFLDVETQQKVFDGLFKQRKTITEKALLKYLKYDLKYPYLCEKATGFQKENQFASSLTSLIDFTNIFGKVDAENRSMIETLILWVTLFEDKKILRRKIKNEFSKINDSQLDRICKLNYSGWSRLSEKLLVGIKAPNDKGVMQSIMECLRDSRFNFMQIVASEKSPFKKLIEEEAKITGVDKITPAVVDSLAASPAIRRGILQAAAIVNEIIKIMGHEPKKIFIEFAREDSEKKRTQSRKKLLEKKYEALKKNPEFAETFKELKTSDNKSFDDRMLYLYFLQNGKCMYSGKALNIERLSQECQIDHIVPQSYIKDDSFDNIVLVYSGENQKKTDRLMIDPDIQRNRKAFWASLRRNELISQKKYDNLIRNIPFNDNDMAKFINRQLVETRQITKHVASLFSSVYQNTEIIEIKSGLSHDIRMQYGLYKSREINDFHHAHDALLAITVGRYVNVCYPKMSDEFNYNAFIKSFKKPAFAISKKIS